MSTPPVATREFPTGDGDSILGPVVERQRERETAEVDFAAYLADVIENAVAQSDDTILRVDGDEFFYVDSDAGAVFALTVERVIP